MAESKSVSASSWFRNPKVKSLESATNIQVGFDNHIGFDDLQSSIMSQKSGKCSTRDRSRRVKHDTNR